MCVSSIDNVRRATTLCLFWVCFFSNKRMAFIELMLNRTTKPYWQITRQNTLDARCLYSEKSNWISFGRIRIFYLWLLFLRIVTYHVDKSSPTQIYASHMFVSVPRNRPCMWVHESHRYVKIMVYNHYPNNSKYNQPCAYVLTIDSHQPYGVSFQ